MEGSSSSNFLVIIQPGRACASWGEQAGCEENPARSPSGLAAKVPPRVGQLGVARSREAAAAPTTSPGPRNLGRRPGTLVVDLEGAQRGLDGHSTT